MTQPLAFLMYEKLLPGSQVANRLRDLGYRVHTVTEPELLCHQAEAEKPMVVLMDLFSNRTDTCAQIQRLRNNPATSHIPVLAFVTGKNTKLMEPARKAGATLVAADEGVLHQLPQLLEQALEVE